MTPPVQCSAGNINFFPGNNFTQTKRLHFSKYNASQNHIKQVSYISVHAFPRSAPQLIPLNRIRFTFGHGSRRQITAAVGNDLTVEGKNLALSGDGNDEAGRNLLGSAETSEAAPQTPATSPATRSKRPKPARKSDMPPVKDEELIPGASFIGKVRSIQPFGAFVDFGAFTDGLVHVSRISDGFVKDVAAVVSIGQEVKVKIVEANKDTGRISLTMRDGDDTNKTQQRKEAPASESSDKPRSVRKNASRSNQKRDEGQKSTKLVLDQVLDGTVKSIIRSGAFISLPDGEEGFLPVSEEYEGFGNTVGNTSLQVGQEVNVRVLRFSRGQVTLTMKKEDDVEAINRQLNQGVVPVATNPFQLAFRQNKEIAAFLDEREREQNKTVKEKLVESTIVREEGAVCTSSSSGLGLENGLTTSESIHEENSALESIPNEQVSVEVELVSDLSQGANFIPETSIEDKNSSTVLTKSSSIMSSAANELVEMTDAIALAVTKDERVISAADTFLEDKKLPGIGSSSTSTINKNEEASVPAISTVTEVSSTVEEVLTAESSTNERVFIANDVSESSTSSTAPENKDEVSKPENLASDEILAAKESDVPSVTKSEEIKSSARSSADEKDLQLTRSESESSEDGTSGDVSYVGVDSILSNGIALNDGMDKEALPLVVNVAAFANSVDTNVNAMASANSNNTKMDASITAVQPSGNPDQGSSIKATVSPALVKLLREETGAGIMDCKKALAETNANVDKAREFLRKKGLASAEKKASRVTAEGRVGSYVHDSRIGVLIEVNCETDFVSRGEIFQQLVDDLAMQVAACPQVTYLVPEHVPEEIVNKEREIEMQKEDLLTKPEQIRSKIVDGRIKKRLAEFSLLEQPYIKDDKMIVKDWVKQIIAAVGENIKVKRFVRYDLGEGLEKKSQDFAAEVAAQTAPKPSPSVPNKETTAGDAAQKPLTTSISAALVKQLREETGAGMMECKNALSETGGNLDKAQDYLRKKGLASADRKSSRLAAEGRISSYVHDSRIGCLIEVNSETDFVGRNEKFVELVDDLAMQVVACPQVEFVAVGDIPESTVNREKEIEMEREDLQSKPEHIREKIVEGRISKRLGELALLEQPFIKDDSVLVKDLVKRAVAALGENIKVRRFIRYTLGEIQD